jgi:hypothetical protein
VSGQPRAAAGTVRERLTHRAMVAVQNRRVFPYLVAVTALTGVVTGLVAHLIETQVRSAPRPRHPSRLLRDKGNSVVADTIRWFYSADTLAWASV